MSKTFGCAVVALALATGVTSAGKEALMDPAKLTEQSPETYRVRFDTSEGAFTVEVDRASAPVGSDRFYNLVKNGFYDDMRAFRVVPNFVVQFGMNGDPAVQAKWQNAKIQDDPVKGSNTKGTITFATAGPNSRTSQVFINLRDNAALDSKGFSPFGKVVEGMDVVEKLYSGYGDAPKGPNQGQIAAQGNAYLDKDFPQLSKITKATIVPAAK
jgi:peptidyl-prolyl cis-trans isomerase A (cyclophilin A)